MAHPGALAAARSLAAGMGTGAAGPSLAGVKPNYDDGVEREQDAQDQLAERAAKDEGRQRREFLTKMAEHGLERPAKSKGRQAGPDDDDDDDDEVKGTAYDADDDDGEQRPMSKRLRKAHAFAEQQGLSKRAVEAMSEQELLVWARKQSRRESRLNRVPKGTARDNADQTSTRAGAPKQHEEASAFAMPSKEALKGHAKKLAEARGWSDEDADALTSFGEGLLESVKLALEPTLRSVVRDQEDRTASALEDERVRLVDRFPELSDDEVFDDLRETADWLIEQGRATNPRDALRKAVRMEFDDDDYVERRVEEEIETRSSSHRRKGRPMIARQLRAGPPVSEEDRTSTAMQSVFNRLLADDKRGAQRAWQKRNRA